MLLRSIILSLSLSACSSLTAQEAFDVAQELRSIRCELQTLADRISELERKQDIAGNERVIVCDMVRVSFSSHSEKQEALNEIKRIGNLAFIAHEMRSRDGWEKGIPASLDQHASADWRYALENLPLGQISNVIETNDSYRLIIVRQR